MASGRKKGESSRKSKSRQTKTGGVGGNEPPPGDDYKLDGEILPPRIFATNRYPPDGRINAYSKPEYLLDLVQALEGTEEFQKIAESPFGTLFQLPVRKCSLSGKLVHNILCRGLVTEKQHEIWFVYGKYPIRFSLREFAIVTGLPCGPFPPADEIREMQTTLEGQNRYWDTLIGTKNATTVQEIVNMLKRDQRKPDGKKMPGWRRLRLALIVIVEGILICGSQPVRASLEVVEMVRDLNSFMAYPWGRESFELTLRMIKVGSKVETLEMLLDKFLQSHTLCHGFPLAIQLLIFRSCPLLEQYLPDDDEETFAESEKMQLSKLKSYHNNNILQTEFDPNLKVQMVIETEEAIDEAEFSWATENEDPAGDYIERLIDQGHEFKLEDWQGGYTGCALMTPPPPKRAIRQGRLKPCKGHVKKGNKDRPEDDDNDDLLYEIEVINYANTVEIKQWYESKVSVLKEELKREILDELRVAGTGSRGKERDGRAHEVNIRSDFDHSEDVSPVDYVLVDSTCNAVDYNQPIGNCKDPVLWTERGNTSVDKINDVLKGLKESGILTEKTKDNSDQESSQEEDGDAATGVEEDVDHSEEDSEVDKDIVDKAVKVLDESDPMDICKITAGGDVAKVDEEDVDHSEEDSEVDKVIVDKAVKVVDESDPMDICKSTAGGDAAKVDEEDVDHSEEETFSGGESLEPEEKVNAEVGELNESGIVIAKTGDESINEEESSDEEDTDADNGNEDDVDDEVDDSGIDMSNGESDEEEGKVRVAKTDGEDIGGMKRKSRRGEKRSNESVKSDCSMVDPSRPKRARVLPRRFRSLTPAKLNKGVEDLAVYTPFGGVDGQKRKKVSINNCCLS